MSDQHLNRARAFGTVAESYDRGRPGYPREVATWLTAEEPVTVLELGAGTGKLTRELVALGHDVHATDPDRAMLDVLARHLPDVRTSLASAEEIPAGDRTVDVVVAAQCFHWFDSERALAEIARVLRPGGRVALVWNQRDARIPWVRRLGALLGDQPSSPPVQPLTDSRLFGPVEDTTFRSWHSLTRTTVLDLVRSRSSTVVMDESERERLLADVLALYDDYGRGMDGMLLPHTVHCFRATVVDRPEPEGLRIERQRPHDPAIEPPTDGDSGLLLIDFR